ncbi:MAG: hypothetical protein WBH55_10670 [Bacteroidota bacterium]
MNRFGLILALVVSASALAQQSDYAIKRTFEERAKGLKEAINGAGSLSALDSLREEITGLENEFSVHRDFLDRALYPMTFSETLSELRGVHLMQYDRTYLTQTQGARISELEAQVSYLTRRLDTLAAERDSLFRQLRWGQKSSSSLRQTSRRLSATLRARDRLIFTLVDSLFLPYGRDIEEASYLEKESLSRRIAQTDILGHIYEIATDNVRFLELTELEPEDYAQIIGLYQQFGIRWDGLRDGIMEVSRPVGKGKKREVEAGQTAAAQIDSVIILWGTRLNTLFWDRVRKEFSARSLQLAPFGNSTEFSESIEAYVEQLRERDVDPGVFVNDVWKLRIDREWRNALTNDIMLGRAEYGRLDSLVSELARKKFDREFILYSLILLTIVIAVWWFFVRTPKRPAPAQQKSQ